jgi:uncharacterized protein YegL
LITFGGSQAELNLPLPPAHQLHSFTPLVAQGMTPLGGALSLASEMIEDKDCIPSRAYKPVIVLVSDGYPNDEWQGPFARLVNGERSSKATRFAMAIGADSDEFLSELQTALKSANAIRLSADSPLGVASYS